MLHRRAFAAALGAAFTGGPALALDVDDDNAIREVLRRRTEVERRAIGMALCVVRPHRTRFFTAGREHLTGGRSISADTVFEIGSVTKVFTAFLLADMARRAEVALDDPVSRHLPGDFRIRELDGRPITLADLASHTSGLPRFPPFPGPPLSPAFVEAMARFSVDDFKAWLAEVLPRRPPSGWEYSNAVGYALLGLALSHRGGRPYEALVQARVIDPLGLRNTGVRPTAAMRRRLADGHDQSLKPLPPVDFGILAPAGGLRSTPRDMAHFASAILPGRAGRLASDARLLLSVRRPAPPIGGVQALGWEVIDAPGGAFVSKDGVSAGQAASIVFDPDRRLAVVAFSNTMPDLRRSTPSGGGIGAADLARHLLRPGIPIGA